MSSTGGSRHMSPRGHGYGLIGKLIERIRRISAQSSMYTTTTV